MRNNILTFVLTLISFNLFSQTAPVDSLKILQADFDRAYVRVEKEGSDGIDWQSAWKAARVAEEKLLAYQRRQKNNKK